MDWPELAPFMETSAPRYSGPGRFRVEGSPPADNPDCWHALRHRTDDYAPTSSLLQFERLPLLVEVRALPVARASREYNPGGRIVVWTRPTRVYVPGWVRAIMRLFSTSLWPLAVSSAPMIAALHALDVRDRRTLGSLVTLDAPGKALLDLWGYLRLPVPPADLERPPGPPEGWRFV